MASALPREAGTSSHTLTIRVTITHITSPLRLVNGTSKRLSHFSSGRIQTVIGIVITTHRRSRIISSPTTAKPNAKAKQTLQTTSRPVAFQDLLVWAAHVVAVIAS